MKITVVSTSRADWNSTGMVLRALVAAGHDAAGYLVPMGFEAREALYAAVKADGAAGLIEHGDEPSYGHPLDNPRNLALAAGNATSDAGRFLARFKPDMVLIAGDRWEVVPVALAARLAGIQIAHLAGGDRTTGSNDDRWRDTLTMLADWHFVTSGKAEDRLVKDLSMSDHRVFLTGSPSVDRIVQTECHSIEETRERLGVSGGFILVNWQPETASITPNLGLHAILSVLDDMQPYPVVFVSINPEPGAEEAAAAISRRGWDMRSLPPKLYLSALKYANVLIGNSSSGPYEAPYYGTPVINVGDRQKGRIRSPNIICCAPRADAVRACMDMALALPRFEPSTPYGTGNACDLICEAIHKLSGARL